MDKLYIVCVDDQRDVLNTLSEDLEELEPSVMIEECESVTEALEVIESIDTAGDHVALIITDQVMPKNTGVDLLQKITKDTRFQGTKKVLLTGLATHQDTIDAINTAQLDKYIEKPWEKKSLHQIIHILITEYILDQGIDYRKYTSILDQETLLSRLRKTTQ